MVGVELDGVEVAGVVVVELGDDPGVAGVAGP